jgi:hypothetical protein
MKAFRILSAVMVVMTIGLVGAVSGDVAPEKKSTLTIDTPLEVPGAILDPGTYVVKLVDTQSNRNIVTITSVDEKKVYATAICTPHVAADDPRHTTFMFYGTPEGANKVLRTWYAPNDRYGQDFVYPADRAAALRQVTNAEVPAMTAEQSSELANRPAPVAVVSDAEPPTLIAPPAPPPPAPAVVAETAPAPAPATMTADASETLPKTASKTPLVLAAGILALGVASGLRFAGRS